MTLTVSISSDYHEVVTERYYDRSASVYAQLKALIPTMEEVQREFRHVLPASVEMTAAPVCRVLMLEVDGAAMLYKRDHAYVKVTIENCGLFSEPGPKPHPRAHDHVRGAYLEAARWYARWLAERAARIGDRSVLHIVGGTVLIEPGRIYDDIPPMGIDYNHDAFYAVLASYYFLTPDGKQPDREGEANSPP